MCGGGDSGSNYYENQDKLFGAQADIATNMYNQYAAHGAPLLQGLSKQAQEGVDPEKYAGLAQSDAQTAAKNAQASSERDAARMGINPSSGAFAQTMADNNLANTANQAGAQNKARADSEKLDWARKADVAQMYSGMPGQSVTGLNSAGQGYGQMAGAQNQNNMANAQGYGQMGAAVAKSAFGAADGGSVDDLKRRGLRNNLAAGGMPTLGDWRQRPGTIQKDNSPSPITSVLSAAVPVAAAEVAKPYLKEGVIAVKDGIGKLFADKVAEKGAEEALGQGIRTGVGEGFKTATGEGIKTGLEKGAETVLEKGAETVLEKGAETAATAAVETAATAGATAAGESAAAPVLAAMGPIGWGLGAAGLAYSLFKKADGGPIKDPRKGLRKNMIPGGEVNGPGTPTSDSIPAQLSDGEFVLNARAVEMIGKDKLNALNNMGLRARGQAPQQFACGGAVKGRGAKAASGGLFSNMGVAMGAGVDQWNKMEAQDIQKQQLKLAQNADKRGADAEGRLAREDTKKTGIETARVNAMTKADEAERRVRGGTLAEGATYLAGELNNSSWQGNMKGQVVQGEGGDPFLLSWANGDMSDGANARTTKVTQAGIDQSLGDYRKHLLMAADPDNYLANSAQAEKMMNARTKLRQEGEYQTGILDYHAANNASTERIAEKKLSADHENALIHANAVGRGAQASAYAAQQAKTDAIKAGLDAYGASDRLKNEVNSGVTTPDRVSILQNQVRDANLKAMLSGVDVSGRTKADDKVQWKTHTDPISGNQTLSNDITGHSATFDPSGKLLSRTQGYNGPTMETPGSNTADPNNPANRRAANAAKTVTATEPTPSKQATDEARWFDENAPTDVTNNEGTPNLLVNSLNKTKNFFADSARKARSN